MRELPAGYVAEHVEHAYCLTGHGMQGGTVEHATVLAQPRELSQGWSYTALSRARGATRLHIDGRDVPAATVAERAELAPHERQEHPDRAQVLARAAARMRVRDDEDLAVTQLPRAPRPGARTTPSSATLRRAPPPPCPSTPLSAPSPARRTRPSTRAWRRSGPRPTASPRSSPACRCASCASSIRWPPSASGSPRNVTTPRRAWQALPAPERTLLGRTRDPHAAERARLAAAVGAADQQLVALDQHAARLERDVGPVQAVRDERDGLDRRLAQLDARGPRPT